MGICVALTFIVLQLVVTLILVMPGQRDLSEQHILALLESAQNNGFVLSVNTINTALVCLPLVVGFPALKWKSKINDYLLRWPQLPGQQRIANCTSSSVPEESSVLGAQMDREFAYLYFAKTGRDALFGATWQANMSPALTWFADKLYRRKASLNGYHACLSDFYALRAKRGDTSVLILRTDYPRFDYKPEG